MSLQDAREKIEGWLYDYNTFRPRSSLEDLTPEDFRKKHLEAGNLSSRPALFGVGAQPAS